LLQNNIIANCSDVGIYINKGARTSILNNTLVETSGIDIRFDSSTAIIANNLVDGRVRERDSGTIEDSANNVVEIDPTEYFQDPANLDLALTFPEEVLDQGRDENVTHDFCGRARTAPLDIGALEYSLGPPCLIATNLEDLLDSKVPAQNNNNNPNNPNNTNSGTNSSTSNQTNGTNGPTNNNTNSATNNSSNQETFEDEVQLENTGCGCASSDGPPWSILILLFGFGLLRRKRTPLT
jgi:MYXO-CTERM domain-containing protein